MLFDRQGDVHKGRHHFRRGEGGLKNLGNGAVMTFFGEVTELRTVKGEGRVKKLGKSADVLYGRPPSPSLALLPSQP